MGFRVWIFDCRLGGRSRSANANGGRVWWVGWGSGHVLVGGLLGLRRWWRCQKRDSRLCRLVGWHRLGSTAATY